MKISSVAAGLPCGISAKKRRYSSTAVGFPIRNDQKPYTQGISEGFPTCIGARRVRIYVRRRHFCEYQSYEALHSPSSRSTYLPLFDASTPSRVQNLPLSRPCQHHVSVLNRPCDLPGSFNPPSDYDRTWSLRKRTKQARLASRPTRLRLMLCSACPTVDQTNATRCCLDSIGIVSGFTWESLEDVPHSLSTHYALVMYQSQC